MVEDKNEYKLKQIRKNLNDANILFTIYAGKNSTLTSGLEYLYYSYITANCDTKQCFTDIANIKLLHNKLLGETIHQLGQKPVYADGRYFFNGGFINYENNLKTILENCILVEQQYIDNYKNLTLYLQNSSINYLFDKLIADNKLIVQILEDLYRQNFY